MAAESAVSKTDVVDLSDEEFLLQFETCTLPYVHWTHRAHLRVATIYVTRLGLADAIPKVTAGIRAYNQSKGIVDTPTSGYHETMTVAWLYLVAAAVENSRASAESPAPTLQVTPAEQFLESHPPLLEKKPFRRYYSPERFCSPEAKYTFVPPDLSPLPGLQPMDGMKPAQP